MLRLFSAVIGGLLVSGCSVFGLRSGYEQPPYDVVASLDADIEVRRYEARLAAETSVETTDREAGTSEAFRVLAAYIFGQNQAREEVAMTAPVEVEPVAETIAMTAPVETARGDAGLTMRFFMPSQWTIDTLPKPTDPRIRIVEVPGDRVAVLRFSGLGRAAAVETRTAELLSALEGSEFQPVAEPVTYYYDPPWTLPFLRRNEVAVSVAQR